MFERVHVFPARFEPHAASKASTYVSWPLQAEAPPPLHLTVMYYISDWCPVGAEMHLKAGLGL